MGLVAEYGKWWLTGNGKQCSRFKCGSSNSGLPCNLPSSTGSYGSLTQSNGHVLQWVCSRKAQSWWQRNLTAIKLDWCKRWLSPKNYLSKIAEFRSIFPVFIMTIVVNWVQCHTRVPLKSMAYGLHWWTRRYLSTLFVLSVNHEIYVVHGKISFLIVSVFLRSTNDAIHFFFPWKHVKVIVDRTGPSCSKVW